MEVKEMGWIILGIIFIIVLGSLLKGVKPRPLFIVILSSFWILTFTIARRILAGTMDTETGVPVVVVLVIFLIVWLVKCIMEVSTVKMKDADGEEHEVPAIALGRRWGNPIWARGPGLYWRWWPFDLIWSLIPTIVYKMNIAEFEVHTLEKEDGESAKPVKVTVAIHVNFPKPKDKYDLHESEIPDDQIPRPWRDIVEPGTLILTGEKLLMNRTFFTLAPKIPLDEAKMTAHFRDAVVDGLITKMPQFTYKDSREKKKELEVEIKKYWLTDPANLFVRIGIPPQLLDVSVTFMRSTDEVEHALYVLEISQREGKAEARKRLAIGDAHRGIKASLGKKLPSEEKDRMTHDYVTRQMSLDRNALTDIRVEGAEGMEKGFLNMIALVGKLFGAGFEKPPRGETDKGHSPKEKSPEEMTNEELREVENRLYAKYG